MYNLAEDEGEKNNLAGNRPEKADNMMNKIRQWTSATDAPVPEVLNQR